MDKVSETGCRWMSGAGMATWSAGLQVAWEQEAQQQVSRDALGTQPSQAALKALSIGEPCCSAPRAAMKKPDGLHRHHSRTGQGSKGVIKKVLGRVLQEWSLTQVMSKV